MRLIAVSGCLCLVLAAMPCPSAAEDRIVAVVNKEVITSKEVRDFEHFLRMQLSREYGGAALQERLEELLPDVLDKLIEDRIILQEAGRFGVQVNEERVKAKMREIRQRYASEYEFKEDLKKQGLVPADVERKIREQFMTYAFIDDRVKSRVEVKPEEVTAYYRQHSAEYNRAEERFFDSAAAPGEEAVRACRHDLVRGQSLEVVKQRYAVKTDTLSVFKGQGLKPDLEQELFALPEGGVSDVIRVGDTWYIFRLTRINPARTWSLQEVQDQIYARLYQSKLDERMRSWMKELKDKAYIKILR